MKAVVILALALIAVLYGATAVVKHFEAAATAAHAARHV